MARDEALAQVRRERIRQVIDSRFGGSQVAFATRIRKSASQVGHWLAAIRNPNGDTCREIEQRAGLPHEYLDGKDPAQTPVAHGLSYTPDTLPQKTREQLMAEDPQGEFWVELWDDAIAAELPRGTLTLWDAGLEPEPGDFVMLRTKKDGLPHVRVYAQAFGAAWEGRPLHDSYATIPGGAAQVLAVFVSAKLRRSQRRR